MELKCLKALEQLREDTLLFTSEFLEVIGTHLINLQKMKDWVDFGATQQFWTQAPEWEIQYPRKTFTINEID